MPLPFDLILIDRDGVINIDNPGSVRKLSHFHLRPSSLHAIAKLNQADLKTALVTNQAVIARGELSLEGLGEIHQHLIDELHKVDGRLDQIYFCPDATIEPNNRRKPAPGMLLEAMAYFNVPPQRTLMIGDDLRDLQAAQSAGCYKALVKTGKGHKTLKNPQFCHITHCTIYDDLAHCVEILLSSSCPTPAYVP